MIEVKKVDRPIKYFIIHCAFTTKDMDIGAADIDRWHRAKGWAGIGYNYFIKFDGTIESGRDLGRTGAHTLGYNHNSIGICLEGGKGPDGKAQDTLTVKQWEAVIRLYHEVVKVYPNIILAGHNQYNKKPCPSFDVREYAAKYKLPCYQGEPYGV